MNPKILVRHVSDVDAVDCPCGKSSRILTQNDNPAISLHYTEIKGAKSHYHKKTTEIYYILEGTGEMLLDVDRIELRPGLCVHIPPGVRHRVIGSVNTLVVAAPAFDPDDEFFDEK